MAPNGDNLSDGNGYVHPYGTIYDLPNGGESFRSYTDDRDAKSKNT